MADTVTFTTKHQSLKVATSSGVVQFENGVYVTADPDEIAAIKLAEAAEPELFQMAEPSPEPEPEVPYVAPNVEAPEESLNPVAEAPVEEVPAAEEPAETPADSAA